MEICAFPFLFCDEITKNCSKIGLTLTDYQSLMLNWKKRPRNIFPARASWPLLPWIPLTGRGNYLNPASIPSLLPLCEYKWSFDREREAKPLLILFPYLPRERERERRSRAMSWRIRFSRPNTSKEERPELRSRSASDTFESHKIRGTSGPARDLKHRTR